MSEQPRSKSWAAIVQSNRPTLPPITPRTHPTVAPNIQSSSSVQEGQLEAESEPKGTTCLHWAEGACYFGEECTFAHYLFPVIVYRSHNKGSKSSKCNDAEQCIWPNDICGFMHRDDENAKGLRDNWEKKRPEWRAILKYRCNHCELELPEQHNMVWHCERQCQLCAVSRASRASHKPLPPFTGPPTRPARPASTKPT